MPNPLAILPNAVSQSQPQVIYGEVSAVLPAPSSFGAPLYVTRPGWDAGAGFFWTFTDWPACHGSTLPAQGAACVLLEDTSGALRCVWWDSATTAFAPTGPAGGDLSGVLPNPTVAHVLGGQTPVSESTALGGVLSGTLPDPGFSSSAPTLTGFTYQNGWGDYGSPWSPAGHRQGALGHVQFEGMITKNSQTGLWTAFEIMGSCPAPTRNLIFPAMANDTAGSYGVVEVRVYPNGTFGLGPYGAPANNVSYVSLAAVAYYT